MIADGINQHFSKEGNKGNGLLSARFYYFRICKISKLILNFYINFKLSRQETPKRYELSLNIYRLYPLNIIVWKEQIE